ncbi:YdcF family protein [Lutispora sp.]|uniref:YdcF family protein n=1 Tax=Lutispora sp. TaxID=2828727 RepID=UPI002B20A34E|nr:YdcF family protein [Lutispora sp.]MEA4964039.1 YdcF family protein [Lutispora sp.]
MKFVFSSISDFIFMEDDIEPADVILIPGGSHKQLIESAAKLYHDGFAPYILPSGGSNVKLPEYNSEWEFLYKNAIELGVPKEAILKEDKASHTFENAQFSLSLLREKGIDVKKVILVCKNFHSRRAYLTYATIFPSNIKIMVYPVVDGKDITKNNWLLDEGKIHIVMSEVVKIGSYFEKHVFLGSKKVDKAKG